MTEPEHGLNKDAVRADLQRACAIVHGRGAKLSLLELCVLILKDGLLSESERAQRLAEKLQTPCGPLCGDTVCFECGVGGQSPPSAPPTGA